jgi:RHS repeat-associated protein
MSGKAIGTAISAILVLVATRPAAATEICGNSIDDDGNGLTDESCYPTLATGVCESPLSCGDTGMVSWTTGSLHYDLPPDIAPRVPFGPGIGLRRFYTSAYSPTGANPTTVNHTPLGANWQHTYMTWLYDFVDSGSVSRIVLHTSQGRDIFYTFSNTVGSVDYYTPQAGEHVMSLRRDRTSTTVYYVQLLTGETLKYNASGQIIEIWDTLASTPNKVLITWTGTSNGNVSTVTDASGNRRLSFSYTNNLLTSVTFQTNQAGTWTTQHTTSYDYTNGVTRDATSQWFVPQSSTEWSELLIGTGISNPTNMWKVQETSGSLADSIGTATLTATNNGGMSYAQTVSGWTRKAVTLTDASTSKWANSSLCNPKTTSCTAFAIAQLTTIPGSTSVHDMMSLGDSNGARGYAFKGGVGGHSSLIGEAWNGTATGGPVVGASGTSVKAFVLAADPTNHFTTFQADTDSVTPTWATGTSNTGAFTIGDNAASDAPAAYLYAAVWSGTALTSTQRTTLINRIKNGAGLSQVTIGGTLAQKYVYDSSGYLTQVKDGADVQIAAFGYSSTSAGQVDIVTTSRGAVGFEYASTRTGCSGSTKTMLYFNQGNSTSCSIDSDCGSGFMCGGKTGSGSTGKCFLAGRCLTTSAVNGESVVTDVAAMGPGGGTCSGACIDVMHYAWTGAGTNINPTGTEDALTNFTSVTYNSNGLPTQIGYGDTDADPTNGGTNRTEYLFYDSTFPGRLAEVRRASDLDPSASSCSSSSTTGCARTLYCYGSSCSGSCSADNQLCTVEQTGKTLDSSGSVVSLSSKITYVHDSKGRVSEIDGAVSGIKTLFLFNAPGGSADGIHDNFLASYKIYKDSTNYLQPQIADYDFWGNPTSLKAPDGNYTCDTYDANLGYLATRRRAMASQTSCATTDSSDLSTSWERDSWQRLTKLSRPDGACVHYGYDTSGRLLTIKRRDNCNKDASGETQQLVYSPNSPESLVTEIDTYDASSTETATQPYTYFASRRLQNIVNPDHADKFTGLVYDAAGKVTEVDGADSLSKSVFHFDGAPGRDGRVTSVEKYKTSSTSDTWILLYAWRGDQSQVTDGDSKVTGSTRDDIGRLVKITSPDLGGPTVRVLDAGSRLTTIVEVLGGGSNQQTHNFTFDAMGRTLTEDYQGACATTGTAHAEITRAYDALPSGVSCPSGRTCNNLSGRLAYVKTILMCSSTYSASDGSLDQETFFSYDAAGRLVEEFIQDDSGRTADHLYEYTKSGALSKVTTPSGAVLGWTYGTAGANSDTDRVNAIWRGTASTPIADNIQWFPFGPWKQYDWQATISSTKLRNRVGRNLAYRITTVFGAETVTGSSVNAKVTIGEDAMGRVTSRVYAPHDPSLTGLFDSYFLYDQQSRVLCETTDLQSTCPTSGSNLKNNHSLSPPFLAAGDWKQILRPIPGSTGLTNNFNSSGTTYGTSHQITDMNQSDGTPTFGHTAIAYDARGLRSYDDNTTTLTNDRRDYTYDARHNVVNVRGQYYTGTAWHYYDVASAFDHQNRRVFKSFYDETTTKTTQWFFYYDARDRLTEIKYTPDTSVSGTYSQFQLSWLGSKLVHYWQSDFVSNSLSATSKRYVAGDETDRPIQLWSWPSSGDSARVWAISPSAWGVDKNIVGNTVFQPILFAGQYQDVEAVAYENDGTTVHRASVALNGFRTYDTLIGGYLQFDPLAPRTWDSYVYAGSDPVGVVDRSGLAKTEFGDNGPGRCDGPHVPSDQFMVIQYGSKTGDGKNGLPKDKTEYWIYNTNFVDWYDDHFGPKDEGCDPWEPEPADPKFVSTFPGDTATTEHGCFPTASYTDAGCYSCLRSCASLVGVSELCFTQSCDSASIAALNECKQVECSQPNNNFVCATQCGFAPPTTTGGSVGSLPGDILH